MSDYGQAPWRRRRLAGGADSVREGEPVERSKVSAGSIWSKMNAMFDAVTFEPPQHGSEFWCSAGGTEYRGEAGMAQFLKDYPQ